MAVRDRLSSLLPPCDIPGLLRLLRYILLEHQYQTWIRRNEAQPRLDQNRLTHGPNDPGLPRPPQNPLLETGNASDAHEKIPGAGIEPLGNVCGHAGKTFPQLSHRTATQSLIRRHGNITANTSEQRGD